MSPPACAGGRPAVVDRQRTPASGAGGRGRTRASSAAFVQVPCMHQHHAATHAAAEASPAGSLFSWLFSFDYTPRMVCMNREWAVIWLHVLSDLAIAAAYFSIPIALVYFVHRRRDVAFNWMFWMFAAFIFACGSTHVFNVLAVWMPMYRIDGLVKAATGAISIATAIMLWPLIPRALVLPSPDQLRDTNRLLEAEVAERRTMQAELQSARDELDRRVRMRTAELESFLANAPVGFAYFDREGRCLRMNGTLARTAGGDAVAHTGRSVADLLPALAPAIEPALRRAFEGESVEGLEVTGEAPDAPGEQRHWLVSAFPTLDPAGEAAFAGLVVVDITERKRNEQAASENAQRLSLAFEASGAGDWSWDAVTDAVSLSDRAAEVFGIAPGTPITWTALREMLHLDDRDRARAAAERAISEDTEYDVEYRIRRPDGSERWVAARGRAQYAPDGSPVGMLGVLQDVTERRRAAEAAEFLAGAGAVLASSLDREQTLAAVARLAVPRIADWCSVHLVEDDGLLRLLSAAHTDPAKVDLAWDLDRRYPPDPNAPTGPAAVARTGRTEVQPELSDRMLESIARDPEHLRLLKGLEFRSYISVPIVVRGRARAVITFITTSPGRRYGPTDVALAEELARRTAIGMDNAMLYDEAQAEIARRAAAEAALRENEEKLRLALRASSMGTWSRDVQTGRVEWSEELETLFGLEPGAFAGSEEAFFDFIHPADRDAVAAAVAEAVRSRTEYEIEFRFAHADGGYRWMVGRGRAFYDASGQPVRLAGIGMDITARKLAEQALRESEERFRTMADSAPVMIWMAGADGLRNYHNRPWLEFTGRSAVQEYGNGWTEGVHPEDVAACLRTFLDAFGVREPFRTEYRVRRHDGKYRWVIDMGVPRFSPDGEFVGYIGSCIDITGRRRMEEQLRELTERLETRVRERTAQLEEVNRELESFSYSVSHDLRAPLRHIAGFADMLQRRAAGSLDETSQRYVRTVMEAAAHAGQLVDDLLAFSRMGRAEMRGTTIDFDALVREVSGEVSAGLNGRSVEWRIEPLPQVRGDPAMLRLVVRNLLDNAAKYTGGREPAVIEVGAVDGDDEITVFVRDNGVGFDMQYADKLFGVFQRLHTSQEFEGTGIGLANVRRIISRHGGRTWAEGEPGRGATFYFTLPYAPEGEASQK